MRIEELRNIGPKSAMWLKTIGIETEEDLLEIGVESAYMSAKAAYPSQVSLNLLYALQGAILDISWDDLPEEMKDDLRKRVNEEYFVKINAREERVMKLEEYKVFDGHGKHAQAVAFTKDGSTLTSVGLDTFVRLWRVPEFEQARTFSGHTKSVNSISFSPNEKKLATTSSDGTLRTWTFPEGDEVSVMEKIASARYSRDSRHMATINARSRLELRDADDLSLITEFPQVDKRLFVTTMSPDGHSILAGGTGPIYVFGVETGEETHTLEGHKLAVPCLRYSKNGKWLLSTGAEGTLTIRNPGNFEVHKVVELGMKGVLQFAFAPDDDFVAISGDHRITLVSIPEGQQLAEVDITIKGVYGVAISPDGRFLANAGADGKIRIWELLK